MSLSGSARNDGSQTTAFIRRRVQFSDSGIAAGTASKIGRLPARAFILQISIHKSVVFNSTTSDTLQLGSTAAGADILAATDVHAATGFSNLTAAAGLGLVVTAETDVFVKLNPGTPSTATTGDVTVVIEFTPDNDN